MNVRRCTLWTSVLLFAGVALPNSLAMAGSTTLTVSQGFFLDIEDNNNSHFAIALNSYHNANGQRHGQRFLQQQL